MEPLAHLIRFIKLTHDFQNVERVVLVPGKDRWENDVEHSYQLAMTAWYLASTQHPELSREKLITYALIHDFVEVYAGDTYIYDEEAKKTKKEREEKAAHLLKENFAEFGDLHTLVHHYEERKDPESNFIYALDKILPMINIYLDGGRTWKKEGISLARLLENKQGKADGSPEAKRYLEEFLEILKKEENGLFGAKKEA